MANLDTITRDYAAAQRRAWEEYHATWGCTTAEVRTAYRRAQRQVEAAWEVYLTARAELYFEASTSGFFIEVFVCDDWWWADFTHASPPGERQVTKWEGTTEAIDVAHDLECQFPRHAIYVY